MSALQRSLRTELERTFQSQSPNFVRLLGVPHRGSRTKARRARVDDRADRGSAHITGAEILDVTTEAASVDTPRARLLRAQQLR